MSGLLSGVTTPYAGNLKYAPHGAETQVVYGNQLWRSKMYNSRLQMSGFVDDLNNGGSSASQYNNVSYDWRIASTQDNGNLGQAIWNYGGPGSGSSMFFRQTFSYDGVNRLMGASDTGGWSRNFYYDAFGNRAESGSGVPFDMNAPVTSTQSVAGLYNANNQLTVAGMGYDAAGNLNQLSGYSALTYDGENRLTSAGRTGGVTMSYQYDGEGRRVAKSGGGSQTIFVYDAGGRMAAEYSTGAEMSTCATCYLSADHLGTPRLITDQNRMLVSRHDYLPFGEEIEAGQAGRTGPVGDGGDSINQKFTGKERDSESGLDYFGARYYGSALGRFTSPDGFNDSGITDPSAGKVIFSPGPLPYADIENPQSLNKYSYVLNNPLRYTDPNGHCIEDACVLEGIAVTSIFSGLSGTTIASGLGFLGGAITNILGGGSQMTSYGIGPNTGLYASQMSANKPGTLGKADHQQTANEEAERMGGQREVTIKTPGGQKESRRADAAKVDENGNVKEATQVYRPTPAGNIPKREVDAANDIQNATGVKPNMVPVRPVKPPCTNSGGSCQQ